MIPPFKIRFARAHFHSTILALTLLVTTAAQAAEPLPSWNQGEVRNSIISFVEAVTDEDSPDFVPESDRIATFDNDGTLWPEYPMYTQVLFAFDRIKALATGHPEWKTEQPFKALLDGDMKTVGASGMEGLMKIVIASHSEMTAEAFAKEASDWLHTTNHPKTGRPYAETLYQPQLELLDYLRANGFKTFIVSGGGIAFMRPVSADAYGIPPYQVIGSSVVSEYEDADSGGPRIVRKPKLGFVDDKAGKPVGIYEHIGMRPILAFGNSDSDMQMIEYTTAGEGRRLGLYLHHTDADREYAYDRDSHVGTLDRVLELANDEGWVIVDMKRDWRTVF